MVQSHLDNFADTELVDLVHGEGLDTILSEDLLLARVDITETDVDKSVGGEVTVDPLVFRKGFIETQEEGDGHAVDVTTVGGLGGVDVSVGIDPDNTSVRVVTVEE